MCVCVNGCIGVCVRAQVHLWSWGDNLYESDLFSYHVGSGDWTLVARWIAGAFTCNMDVCVLGTYIPRLKDKFFSKSRFFLMCTCSVYVCARLFLVCLYESPF